jgi:hypothetical protein
MGIKFRDNSVGSIYVGNNEVFKVILNEEIIWTKSKGNLSDWRYSTAPNGQITLYEYIGSDTSYVVVPTENGNTIVNNYTSGSDIPFYDRSDMAYVDLQGVPFVNNDMSSAFMGCVNLGAVGEINSNITNMSSTFSSCEKFNQNIQIPTTVTDLSGTFFYCTNLNQNIQIPLGVTNMIETFYSCSNFNQNIKIPNNVTSLYQTFAGCTNFNRNIKIPNSVVNLYSTFTGDIKLNQSIQIPQNVTNLQETFEGCTNLSRRINIFSENIASASMCFSNTSFSKNVYIPYNYTNGERTKTFKSFVTAGYLYTNGVSNNQHGVTMHDLNAQ